MSKQMTVKQVLASVILQLGSKLNKKALNEVIENDCTGDLNDMLFSYYYRARNIKKPMFYGFISQLGETQKEWYQTIDGLKNDIQTVKKYKTAYDYVNGGKIKQKDTGMLVEINYGYYSHFSYVLDVYKWLQCNEVSINE
jgi:hypothetical protein